MKARFSFLQNKTVRIVLVFLVALVLLLAVWKVFFPAKKSESAAYVPTEREARLSVLLGEIEGVERATVMITEKEGDPSGAIVVFEGKDGILVRTRIMEAASRALGLSTGDILVYPAQS